MPSDFLALDTQFPTFGDGDSTSTKLNKIMSHLYLLQEGLRYTLRNLDSSNFNQTALTEITEPVYAQIEASADGLRTAMALDAEGLRLTVESLESQLWLKVDSNSFNVYVQQTDDKIAALQLTAESFETFVGAGGAFSQLEQRVAGITLSAVDDGTGAQLKLSNGADGSSVGITLSVTDGDVGSILHLGIGSTTLVSDEIVMVGAVTFADLAGNGTTTINGGNITTGEISAVDFVAAGRPNGTQQSKFIVRDISADVDIGGIGYQYVEGDEDYGDKLYLYTTDFAHGGTRFYPSIKLESVGRISMEAANSVHGLVYILGGGEGVTIHSRYGDVRIQEGNTIWLFSNGSLYKNGTEVL